MLADNEQLDAAIRAGTARLWIAAQAKSVLPKEHPDESGPDSDTT
jgi:hypothetical protein